MRTIYRAGRVAADRIRVRLVRAASSCSERAKTSCGPDGTDISVAHIGRCESALESKL